MKNRVLIGMIFFCGLFLGMVGNKLQAFEIITKDDLITRTIVKNQFIRMAENAIILFDASDSMSRQYADTDMSRYDIAKKVLAERNTYLPDLGYNMGLYTYTPWKAYYPMQPYNREGFASAIESLPEKPTGTTNLENGLKNLEPILERLSGHTVVFVITDGTYTAVEPYRPGVPSSTTERPADIAKKLSEKYNVCFYVISTADNAASREVLEAAASFNFCSRVITFSDFIERPEYNSGALFSVLSTVDVQTVTETKLEGVSVNDILFELNKFEIRPEAHDRLEKLARFINTHPGSYLVLAGYTCDLGSYEHNLGLSQKRVQQVADYLAENYNIDTAKIVVFWFGEFNPVADNTTEEGRRRNRRVEISVSGI
jgi:OOP family OmpA-OmpF porin